MPRTRKMKKGKIFIISGPSGSGKTTLYQKLLASNRKLSKSISVTTRAKRPGEVHARDYYFVSNKMFLYKARSGQFLEHEQFFENFYGTPNKYVNDLLNRGKHVLLCIDVKGANTVVKKHPDAIRIFVKTPSIEDLRRRLIKRGSEGVDSIEKRLKRVRLELQEAKNYDYIIVNDHLNKAQANLNRIIDQEIGE